MTYNTGRPSGFEIEVSDGPRRKPAGMDAGSDTSMSFCGAKLTALKRHGCRFRAAQGIEAEIPQTPRPISPRASVWMNIYYVPADEEEPDYSEFQQITNLFFRLFEGSPLEQVEVSHNIRGFRCLIHGFATIAGHKGFGHPSDTAESFDYCLALYLAGVERKLAGKQPLKDEGHSKL